MTSHRTAIAGTVLTLALCAAASVRAQMPESYRQTQLAALEVDRRLSLAMADSMQERWYREKATPAQRDFAQQVAHAAGAVPMIAAMALGGPRPSLPDTGTIHSRAGLRAFINAAYDYGANLLRTQTAADREASTQLFGSTMPKWQVWDEIHQHTIWTLGQVVANFRAHGNPPPAFMFF
jgi:hypothetical protein